MTQTSSIGQDQSESATGKTLPVEKTGGNQLSFNPIYPSMELPPEQLIRLLGMDTHKSSRSQQTQRNAPPESRHTDNRQDESRHVAKRETPASRQTSKVEQTQQTRSVKQTQRPRHSTTGSRRRALVTPVLIIAALTLLGVSGYWYLGVSPDNLSRTLSQLTQRQSVSGVQDPALQAPAIETKSNNRAAATLLPEAANSTHRHSQSEIDAELLRLRDEAKRRFEQRTPVEKSAEAHFIAPQIYDAADESSVTESAGFGAEPTPQPAPVTAPVDLNPTPE